MINPCLELLKTLHKQSKYLLEMHAKILSREWKRNAICSPLDLQNYQGKLDSGIKAEKVAPSHL